MQAVHPVGGRQDVVPLAPQVVRQRLDQGPLVLDDQDLRLGHRAWVREGAEVRFQMADSGFRTFYSILSSVLYHLSSGPDQPIRPVIYASVRGSFGLVNRTSVGLNSAM